jgi:putative transposase
MHITHRIALDPNKEQEAYFRKACGVARFAYNWGLDRWNAQYQAWVDNGKPKGGYPSYYTLNKELNAIKREEFPWMLEVTKWAPSCALQHLEDAFNRYIKGLNGKPKFKKKGLHDSFVAEANTGNQLVQIDGKRIKLPKIGWVKMHEEFRLEGEIRPTVTISRTANRWYVSILCDVEEKIEKKVYKTIGIDLGVKSLLALSNGDTYKGPKALKKALRKLRKLNKSLSRKEKFSANWYKVKNQLAKLHAEVSNIRKDYLHKITTYIVHTYRNVVIEDLHVKGLVKNRKLARSLMDGAFGLFRSMLEYKCKLYGSNLIVADRFYPSSKTCSQCGVVKTKLSLSEREFICDECGYIQDRDVNAALNLRYLADGSSDKKNACRDQISPRSVEKRLRQRSMKQELAYV